MLKPNAVKVARHEELSALVAQFQSAGNTITTVKAGVAGGLKKKKYIAKVTKIKTA